MRETAISPICKLLVKYNVIVIWINIYEKSYRIELSFIHKYESTRPLRLHMWCSKLHLCVCVCVCVCVCPWHIGKISVRFKWNDTVLPFTVCMFHKCKYLRQCWIINLSDLCPTKITWSFAHNFFKNNFCWTHVHFFVPIFQTSGDISSGFQSQWAAWFMLDEGIHDIHSLRSTFGVTCLLVCIASIAASHMCASSEVRCRIWTADCFHPELFQSISG